MYSTYLWVKSFHLLFVMAWMGSVFYLPRILVNLAENSGQPEVQARLLLMGRRLYRFGHNMFGIAALLGVVLWLGHRVVDGFPTMVGSPAGWLHAKLALVAVLLAYYMVSGRWLKGVEQGRGLPSSRKLRVFNELPVFVLLGIIWLVLAKPF